MLRSTTVPQQARMCGQQQASCARVRMQGSRVVCAAGNGATKQDPLLLRVARGEGERARVCARRRQRSARQQCRCRWPVRHHLALSRRPHSCCAPRPATCQRHAPHTMLRANARGGAHARVAHAPGWPLHGRVSGVL
jgi:hypothetical protein